MHCLEVRRAAFTLWKRIRKLLPRIIGLSDKQQRHLLTVKLNLFFFFFCINHIHSHHPSVRPVTTSTLRDKLVRDRGQEDRRGRVHDDLLATWGRRLALQADLGLAVLGAQLVARLVVLLDATQEVLTAAGRLHVLDAHVDALGQDRAADALVHDHTEGVLGDVVHATGLAVVRLVGHALVDGTVTLGEEREKEVSFILHVACLPSCNAVERSSGSYYMTFFCMSFHRACFNVQIKLLIVNFN